jgi:hypothetical protein
VQGAPEQDLVRLPASLRVNPAPPPLRRPRATRAPSAAAPRSRRVSSGSPRPVASEKAGSSMRSQPSAKRRADLTSRQSRRASLALSRA